MPIKFRCVYCEQLLGIARRKAGTVVKCPNCSGQLMVPSPEGHSPDDGSEKDEPTAAAGPEMQMAASHKHSGATVKAEPEQRTTASAQTESGGLLFERSDFDELLKPVQGRPGPAIAPPAPRGEVQRAITLPDSYSAPPVSSLPAAQPIYSGPTVAPPKKGLTLTPLKLVILLAFLGVGFGAAFLGGLLIGHFVWK